MVMNKFQIANSFVHYFDMFILNEQQSQSKQN